MKVSIITVCFNAEKTIEETINSVLSQTHSNIEYVIIDGGSTDSTVSIIKKYLDRISYFVSESDSGIYFGMNKGLEVATGDVVGILNADDFYTTNDVIQIVVNCFLNDQCDSLYGDLDYVSENDTSKIVRVWISGNYKRTNFLRGWMPPHPTFFVKREFYTSLGKFNTNFRLAADYELMLRFLYKSKLSVSYVPQTLIKMRAGGVSNSSFNNRIKANKEDRMAWEVNGIKAKWYTSLFKPLSKIIQFLKG